MHLLCQIYSSPLSLQERKDSLSVQMEMLGAPQPAQPLNTNVEIGMEHSYQPSPIGTATYESPTNLSMGMQTSIPNATMTQNQTTIVPNQHTIANIQGHIQDAVRSVMDAVPFSHQHVDTTADGSKRAHVIMITPSPTQQATTPSYSQPAQPTTQHYRHTQESTHLENEIPLISHQAAPPPLQQNPLHMPQPLPNQFQSVAIQQAPRKAQLPTPQSRQPIAHVNHLRMPPRQTQVQQQEGINSYTQNFPSHTQQQTTPSSGQSGSLQSFQTQMPAVNVRQAPVQPYTPVVNAQQTPAQSQIPVASVQQTPVQPQMPSVNLQQTQPAQHVSQTFQVQGGTQMNMPGVSVGMFGGGPSGGQTDARFANYGTPPTQQFQNTVAPQPFCLPVNTNAATPASQVGTSGKVCRIQGCDEPAVARRPYCTRHSGNRLCEFPGCTKCAQGSTRFCIAHGGGRRCTFPGCDKGARDKYFCAA